MTVTIKTAVRVLEKGVQQAVLAEALTTQGIIAARMGNQARAGLLLQCAIVIAETVGDREGSGRAHLTGDGSRNRIRLLPFLSLGFLVNLLAIARATLSRKSWLAAPSSGPRWEKTERYRAADRAVDA